MSEAISLLRELAAGGVEIEIPGHYVSVQHDPGTWARAQEFVAALPADEPTGLDVAEDVAKAIGGFLWLANNLHNVDSPQFVGMFRAAAEDARPIYEKYAARLSAQPEGEG